MFSQLFVCFFANQRATGEEKKNVESKKSKEGLSILYIFLEKQQPLDKLVANWIRSLILNY